MTEVEWLSCREPLSASEAVQQLVSGRKLRLCGPEVVNYRRRDMLPYQPHQRVLDAAAR
jgi:hypothetical protein